jgi:hypothetical protein
LAVPTLKLAAYQYAKSPSHLTSLHYIFVRQCLLAKSYDEALGVLDIPIDDLDLEAWLTTDLANVQVGTALSILSSLLLLWGNGVHRPEGF